ADAREAAARYAWGDAFDLFAAEDAVAPLGPDDLDLMAECAWWIGKMRHCIALRERAQTAYRKQGNVRRAARVALDLAQHHGELGARATGMIYCMMISVNSEVADWERAGHWAEAAKSWCDRQSINGFPGVCRVHRAEILRLRGALSEAEEEARVATTELGSFN